MTEDLQSTKEEYLRLVRQHKRTELVMSEWSVFVVPIFRLVRLMIEVLEPLAKSQTSKRPVMFERPPNVSKVNNQYRVSVLPWNVYDKTAYLGFNAEIWIQEGKELTQGTTMLSANSMGKLALVLGAGNQASVGLADVLYKLINCGEVVILKHNPVNQYLYPIYEKAMSVFINTGFFQQCKGGIDEARYLLSECDSMHITGSDKTYDAIVWGNLDKSEPASNPIFTKEITSELGCITPWIIVPGNYTGQELWRIATEVVGAFANNCSFNCVAPKLLVTCMVWNQRDTFLEMVRSILKSVPLQYPYYPGSTERWKKFAETYPNSEKLKPPGDSSEFLPWLFIHSIPARVGELAFELEAWSPVLCEVALEEMDVSDFLTNSVKWCNNHVWGNLSASIFVTEATETVYRKEFELAVKNLRYGTVAINHWTGLPYLWGTPWGAFPGNSQRDIQSGQGFVHNFLMLDHVEKTVTRCPLSLPLGVTLAFSPVAQNAENFSESLANHECSPSILTMGSLAWNSVWN
eukprot:TRINITY_DN10940_c0_g1_i1.p1 TRINITY_DN10940_c0_g1~~TRINITY_DN10940_c0_g1_i1.p1  ORF type:complete len:579 (+),score=118.84 TRINITY_DN10940_c0_g1_i1:183-1739(+)